MQNFENLIVLDVSSKCQSKLVSENFFDDIHAAFCNAGFPDGSFERFKIELTAIFEDRLSNFDEMVTGECK